MTRSCASRPGPLDFTDDTFERIAPSPEHLVWPPLLYKGSRAERTSSRSEQLGARAADTVRMSKKRPKRPKPKRQRMRLPRSAASRRWAAIDEHILAFVEEERVQRRDERIARAALPRPSIYHTSHWLSGGIDQAVSRVGCTPLEAIAVIERMQRWARRTERISQLDLTMQLAGLELRRRSLGAKAELIDLPAPAGPFEMPEHALRDIVADWEGASYALVISAKRPEGEMPRWTAAAARVATHLAQHDGVPIRLERLDPAALASDLTEDEGPAALGPKPEGYVTVMLSAVAELYQRLSDHGTVDAATADRIADELLRMSLAAAGPAYAA